MFNNFFGKLFGSSKSTDFEKFKSLSEEEKRKLFNQKRQELLRSLPSLPKGELQNGLTGLKNLGNTCFMAAAL